MMATQKGRFVLKAMIEPLKHPHADEHKYLVFMASVFPDPILPDAPWSDGSDDYPPERMQYKVFHVFASKWELEHNSEPRKLAALYRDKRESLRLLVEVEAEHYGYEYIDESEPETSPA